MNPPPSSPSSDYQGSWDDEDLRQVLPSSLTDRLNEEIANNPELNARCIDPANHELKADDTHATHPNSLNGVPEEDAEQKIDSSKAEEKAETLPPTVEFLDEAPQVTSVQQENLPPVRRQY